MGWARGMTTPHTVNISHDKPDSTLKEVQDKLTNDVLAEAATGLDKKSVAFEVTRRSHGATNGLVVYLIAHSFKGVLQFGDWTLSDAAVAETLASECRPIASSIKAIVLLGCSTVAHDGWGAMGTLWKAFRDHADHRINVVGTTMPIGEADFTTEGFAKSTLLRGYSEGSRLPDAVAANAVEQSYRLWFAAAPRHPTLPTVRVLQDNLVAASRSEALFDQQRCRLPGQWRIIDVSPSHFLELVRQCHPDVKSVPGLLAIPDYEVFSKLPDGTVWRLTVLLDGWFIRTYAAPRGEGVLLRVPPTLRLRMAREFAGLLRES